jgi:hypothetical protein
MKQRMHFFDQNLNWLGHATRKDLMEKFGISGAQSTIDIRNYLELRVGKGLPVIHYVPQLRRYNTEFEFQPIWDHPVPGVTPDIQERFTSFEYLPLPLIASRDLRTEAAVLSRACVQHWPVMIKFVESGGIESHTIQPHTLAWDGIQLECRAYCLLRNSFHNFGVGRILRIERSLDDSPWHEKQDDKAWHQTSTLCYSLTPNQPDLEVLCLEYGMQVGQIHKLAIKELWQGTVLQRLGFQPMKSPFQMK